MTVSFRRSEVISGLFILVCVGLFTAFAFRVQGLVVHRENQDAHVGHRSVQRPDEIEAGLVAEG